MIRFTRAGRATTPERTPLAAPTGKDRWAATAAALIVLAGSSTVSAQQSEALAEVTQLENIVGDTPEPGSNNWLYPLGPRGNPFHRPDHPDHDQTVRRAQLGKMIFWDEQLSTDNTMACGTCHFPEAGGTDLRPGGAFPSGLVGSLGVLPQDPDGDYGDGKSTTIDRRVTGLAAPTMIGAYGFSELFWDLRAGPDFRDEEGLALAGFETNAGLEAQAAGPPISDVEMGHIGITWSSGEIQEKLSRSRPLALATPSSIPPELVEAVESGKTYGKLFDEVFGGEGGVTRERIAMAIAHYERTLIPNQAPIDLPDGMTKSQVNGFNHMKNNSFSCFFCHSATRQPVLDEHNNLVNPFDQFLSDGRLHFIGLPPPGSFSGSVKTPTLRNFGLRRRFFHSGQMDDIDDVLAFYNHELPGSFAQFGFSPQLTPEQLAEVKDFLVNALTDPRVANAEPPFDRPDLYSERVPYEANEHGTGTPGTGGQVPEILASSPALVGSPDFKIGVGRGRPLARAVLRVGMSAEPQLPLAPGLEPIALRVTFLDPGGIGTMRMPLPADPELIGRRLRVRWVITDPGATSGLALSDEASFLLL